MKIKILSLILAAFMSIFALAACDAFGGDCEHQFSEKWSSDAANHWHAATCEHGEIKDSLEAHKDADEDGVCDVCEYEIGHFHSFESTWTSDDDKHWHKATCSHSDAKGNEELHKDDNTDGVCDICKGHVHTLDGAGFCDGCGKEVKPVVETELGSVVYATTARVDKIVSGTVDYYAISRLLNENGEMAHLVEYLLGTNGTYSKRTEDEVITIGEFPNATVEKTGKTEVLEKWIEIVSDEEVKGVVAISVDGVYKDAEPGAFGTDDLAGYYYAVSTLADGHGAEAVLVALYEVSLLDTVSDLTTNHDSDANKYSFSYNVLIVNETKLSDDTIVYNANYFDVAVEFTYNDDYALTSLDIVCNCYTNDPGADTSGKILEEEIDFDYDAATGKITWRNEKRADTYEVSVTQTVGVREEIELNDGSEFAPEDFTVYVDEELSSVASEIELTVGDNSQVLYIGCEPENAFFAFVKNALDITVKDSDGNEVSGLLVTLTGDVIYLIPNASGEYVIEFTAIGKTKTVTASVTGVEVGGANKLELTTTGAYGWDDYYEFTPATTGTYTFYLPVNFGLWIKADYDANRAPAVDAFDPGYKAEEPHTVTVTLRPGQKFCFYYSATSVGTFTIGYDAP